MKCFLLSILICLLFLPQIRAQKKVYYGEQHRPQIHFSPEAHWMNDPNGMVYYKGEYHLFYQYYPDDIVWGPMHWGHAVSKDLVSWKHLPIALAPDTLGYIFSGSAVVDWRNTSGFQYGKHEPLVAVFTYHNMAGEKANTVDFQYQGIAYSTDNGRNWTKYQGNPVIKNTERLKDFRDPKVFWHVASNQWVMILARGNQIRIYNSPNLKDWTFASDFGLNHGAAGLPWECPDLFELPVDGNPKNNKWVMLVSLGDGSPNGGSGTEYFIGSFDGKVFKNENAPEVTQWVDYGRDNYAGVTWSNVPQKDGRRILLGWMSNWKYAQKVPTSTWRSAMTIPRTLSLKATEKGIKLVSKPIDELKNLRQRLDISIVSQKIVNETKTKTSLATTIKSGELILEFEKGTASDFGVKLSNGKGEFLLIGFDTLSNQFYTDRTFAGKKDFSPDFAGKHYAPRFSNAQTIKWHIVFDKSSVEVFADDGLTVITDTFFPNEDFNKLTFYANNGYVRLKSGRGYPFSSIWKK